MKRLLLLALTLIPMIALAQDDDGLLSALGRKHNKKDERKTATEPFKGAEKIILKYNNAGNELFNMLGKTLIDFGYSIDKKDSELLFMTTERRPIKHVNYIMRVAVKDSTATITGMVLPSIGMQMGYFKTEQNYVNVKYTSKMYELRDVFEEMIKFSEKTGPNTVIYSN
ncbi:hypothetical protein [Chitinophaga sp.]|uniref:hypothetical protein n=1 Tax=Chitinophaga sp. TaxID=1869181 RepID=UPI0031D5358A